MSAFFLDVVNMSITAGYVILAVMVIRLLLRKAPKKYAYFLWSVVGFRLAFPVSFSSVFSFFGLNLFKRKVVQSNTGSALRHVPENVLAASDLQAGAAWQQEAQTGAIATEELVSGANPTAWEQAGNPDILQLLVKAGAALWITGIVILAVYSVASYIKLQRRMDNAVLLKDNVFQSSNVQSPFIMGFLKPRIYIPFGLEENAQRYVLAHERYHLKRGDHVIKLIAFGLLTMHWFNPLCWLAYSLMCKDMEMSCDEKVLSGEAGISKAYSMTLLSFAANRRFPVPSPLSFGETGVKGRIKNVLRFKRCSAWVSMLAAVICAVTVLGCAGNPAETAENQTEAQAEVQTESQTEVQTESAVRKEIDFESVYRKLDKGLGYQMDMQNHSELIEIYYEEDGEDTRTYLGMLALKDAAAKGLEYDRNVEVMKHDDSLLLKVTLKAVVEGKDGDVLYEDDTFEMMIPVTADAAGEVSFGDMTGRVICYHDPMEHMNTDTEYNEKLFSTMTADVTHDGILDYIVVIGAGMEEWGIAEEDAESFFGDAINWGYVRVYDGSDSDYSASNPWAAEPIWESDMSYAHVGNRQFAVTSLDGKDYMVYSNFWAGQGQFTYHFKVFSLDREGQIHVLEEHQADYVLTEATDFQMTDENRKQIADFFEKVSPLYEDAVLVAAIDIDDEKSVYISDENHTYSAAEYYDNVRNRR